jgi:hypothetical protein
MFIRNDRDSDDAYLECLDGPDGCSGDVEYRMPLSSTGKPFPRCEKHWDERLDEQERINERYPDSPCAPSWFDESYAGERWDDEY